MTTKVAMMRRSHEEVVLTKLAKEALEKLRELERLLEQASELEPYVFLMTSPDDGLKKKLQKHVDALHDKLHDRVLTLTA